MNWSTYRKKFIEVRLLEDRQENGERQSKNFSVSPFSCDPDKRLSRRPPTTSSPARRKRASSGSRGTRWCVRHHAGSSRPSELHSAISPSFVSEPQVVAMLQPRRLRVRLGLGVAPRVGLRAVDQCHGDNLPLVPDGMTFQGVQRVKVIPIGQLVNLTVNDATALLYRRQGCQSIRGRPRWCRSRWARPRRAGGGLSPPIRKEP